MGSQRAVCLSHPYFLSAFGASHFMHPCTLGDHLISMSSTQAKSMNYMASGAFCNIDDSREAYIMLWLPVSHPTPLSPLQTLQAEDLAIQCEQQA